MLDSAAVTAKPNDPATVTLTLDELADLTLKVSAVALDRILDAMRSKGWTIRPPAEEAA